MIRKEEELLSKTIEFALERNPIWPFSALIADEEGNILVQATDCAHISPIYHAESLAIHILIHHFKPNAFKELTLVSTAEPDVLSQSSIYWGCIVHDLPIRQIYFGTLQTTLQELWPFGIEISANEVAEKSRNAPFKLFGPLLEKECDALFLQAKKRQDSLAKSHPAMGTLSTDVKDFYWYPNSDFRASIFSK